MPSNPGAEVLAASDVHFIGIGGSGMQALAEVLLARGVSITGSDTGASLVLQQLERAGARIYRGHQASQISGSGAVVVSAAIPESNPELAAARERGMPVATHAQVLGELSRRLRTIAIAGTHGKSTTTALTAHILNVCDQDPVCLGGAYSPDLGGSGRAGAGTTMVVEADEYGRRFLELHPWLAVITNLESDHLDIYGNFEELEATFVAFAKRILDDGHLLYCKDVPISSRITARRGSIAYGFSKSADWRISEYQSIEKGISFSLTAPGAETIPVTAQLRGRHNAQNATSAIAAAVIADVPFTDAAAAVATFRGTRRRFETIYRDDHHWIVDDYAIHPTEIRVTLRAAREAFKGEIWAVFQPHTTHRTRSLFKDFLTAFGDADRVILLPTYHPPGREQDTTEHDADDLAQAMQHRHVELASSINDAADRLLSSIPSNTLIITMGAGDITTIGPILASAARPS